MKPARRLALGSAQFGLAYGIANHRGQVPASDVSAILDLARRSGMDTIDTAIAYGNSEAVLGAAGMAGWRIVSKLPATSEDIGNIERHVRESVAGSLARLGIGALDTLLLHRGDDLLSPSGRELHRALVSLKESGLVRRIGVSIYEPEILGALLPAFALDIVQAPFNVLDRRLDTSGWMARLADRGIEVHARSAFLQGLLLMRADRRPAWCGRWKPLWTAWDRWLTDTGCSALEGSLGFVLAHPAIERVIIGVDEVAQLAEIVTAAGRLPAIPPAALSTVDLDLIHPSRWPVS